MLPKPKAAAGQDQTQRNDVNGQMRIEPKKILEKHRIAVRLHGESLSRASECRFDLPSQKGFFVIRAN
jgi:hypothetical protein